MTLAQQTQKLQKYIQEKSNIFDIEEWEISKIYQELIDCLSDHNHLYYIESKPIISDVEYDQLFDYLKKIEEYFPYMISANSPTQKLINQIQSDFQKAEHKAQMLSLENSYNSQDLIDWEQRTNRILEKAWVEQNPTFYVEPKFDGISIELIYQDWVFIQAITRWDGIIWEDVSENIKTIKSIPKILKQTIPWTISFRWEIMISKSELKRINQERELEWLQIYANTRNLASGSLKQLDTSITASRNLQCFVYDILYSKLNNLENIKIEELWFSQYPTIISNAKINEVVKTCKDPKIKEWLQSQDIDFDGLVIKVQSSKIREELWSTAHHPRWAIAYKFPAEQVSTQIKSVDFQVGRTGIITPVANLEPINLSGATISRVSLHNFDFIKNKNIYQNDFVRIQRSGEVIPYIVWSISERRAENTEKILPPTNCPICNNLVKNIDIHYYCQNPVCPAQIKEKILWFVSKDCMDIEWIWESIVEILVDNKIISNFADLYKLEDFETERIVRRFPWFADKKISEIQKQLAESKKKEFWRLLNGLWISWIWKKTAKDISLQLSQIIENKQWLKSITEFITNPEFLNEIYGIWEKIIEGIISYWKENLELLEKLEGLWLNFWFDQETENKISNESFSISGSFDVARNKIIESMEKNWYRFDSSPNQKTKYMLIWENAGSKLNKAEELGLEILNSRPQITNSFPFLLETQDKKIKNWPAQLGLF